MKQNYQLYHNLICYIQEFVLYHNLICYIQEFVQDRKGIFPYMTAWSQKCLRDKTFVDSESHKNEICENANNTIQDSLMV